MVMRRMLPDVLCCIVCCSLGQNLFGVEKAEVLGIDDITACVALTKDYDLCSKKDGSQWVLASRTGEYGGWLVRHGHITLVSVSGEHVVAQSGDDMYILARPSEPFGKSEQILVFNSRDDVMAAIHAIGIVPPLDLLSPTAIAKSKPEKELRFWRYRYLKGLAGFDDEKWAMISIDFAIIISFLLGTGLADGQLAFAIACIIGAVSGWVGDTLIYEGGGRFLEKGVCSAVAAGAGMVIRRYVKRIRRKRDFEHADEMAA